MKTLFIFYVIFSGLIMVEITLTTLKYKEPTLNILNKILSCMFAFPIGFIMLPILLGGILTKIAVYTKR